jgi:hypothetical protein
MKPMNKIILFSLIVVLLLAGCAPKPTLTSTAGIQIGAETRTPFLPASQASPTPGSTSTPTPDYSPTPDLRLKPEQWMDWPIVPTLSPRAAQIYEQGLAMGNDPHAFSKVGDCQSIPEAFFGVYDKPGQYSLGDQYQYLQETIDYYKGSFGRISQSVRGGFNAAAVLLPMWADPNACNSGETPVECEIRIHKPTIVIISLEVWFKGRTPETYAGYLRQIIEYSISKGVLPVLATKADNVEGDNSINYTIASLAYEYDIPLWNFWLAVQPLPDHGIDPARDGFHITVNAWNMRSFTALQVLDTIWRNLAGEVAAATQISTAQSEQTPDPAFTPAPITGLPFAQVQPLSQAAAPIPSILLDFSRRGLDFSEKLGIYRGNLNGGDWFGLASAGYSLLDLSPDGTKALIRYSNELYSLDLNDFSRKLLTDQLVTSPLQPAYFLPTGDRVAAILNTDGNAVYLLSSRDSTSTRLTTTGENPIELIPSRYTGSIYWQQGNCDATQTCTTDQLFSTSPDGGPGVPVPHPGRLSVSSDGSLAFVQSSPDAWNYLTLVKGAEDKSLYVPGNQLIDMTWSPDGSTLALSTVTVSDYSGKITENFHTLVTWQAVATNLYMPEGQVTKKMVWSPDSSSLLVMRQVDKESGYSLNFNVVDIATDTLLPGGFNLDSEQYLVVQDLFWLGAAP